MKAALMKPKKKAGGKRVGKQLPRPTKAAHIRVEVSDEESRAISDAAHRCGLSISGFVRVAALEAAAALAGDGEEPRRAALDEIVKAIQAAAEQAGQKKPGRPKIDKENKGAGGKG